MNVNAGHCCVDLLRRTGIRRDYPSDQGVVIYEEANCHIIVVL